MKMVNCKVQDDWMGSLESAFLSVTSPTGKTLTLRKIKYWNKRNDLTTSDVGIIHTIRDRVSEYIRKNDRLFSTYSIALSRNEMAMFKSVVEKINS